MRIFGPKKEEVTGGWRKLHSEVLRTLMLFVECFTVIKSRKMIGQGM